MQGPSSSIPSSGFEPSGWRTRMFQPCLPSIEENIPDPIWTKYQEAQRLSSQSAKESLTSCVECLQRFLRFETGIQPDSLPEALEEFSQTHDVPGWWKREIQAQCRQLQHHSLGSAPRRSEDDPESPLQRVLAVRMLSITRGLFRFYFPTEHAPKNGRD